jgi:hypothetical protein
VHNISAKYAEEIGFEDPGGDESMARKFSRLQMIDLTCQTGSIECLRAMQARLVSYLDIDDDDDDDEEASSSSEILPVNLAASIVCYGLLSPFETDGDGVSYFNKLQAKLHASRDVEYRLMVIGALSCYPDGDVLLSFLHAMVEDENRFRAGEYGHAMRSMISRGDAGIGAVLEFLGEKSGEVVERSRDEMIVETIVDEIAGKIFDDELYEKVRVMVY